ncbi:DUF3572 domain-containing protein [Sphingomonas sp. BIUV-7]|uniref:DUF3572 domain-containing protein n=1 Tax=Sphingomonas natans TaxID=3063330 RepID=A0ABT8Y781_9SPHN|nr:DUF3572 domain-containing protein [Sphingomonas sp. BIUV-7]MDO6413862.1 DUF3572 domain-containing protein [Sphingomonas sp. BIUV-7]
MRDKTITTAKRSQVLHGGNDAPTIALRALGWILGDADRASRFLALTGLEPENLRARISEPSLHAAVVAFLAGHESDLISCAEALELAPESIQAAARELQA